MINVDIAKHLFEYGIFGIIAYFFFRFILEDRKIFQEEMKKQREIFQEEMKNQREMYESSIKSLESRFEALQDSIIAFLERTK